MTDTSGLLAALEEVRTTAFIALHTDLTERQKKDWGRVLWVATQAVAAYQPEEATND